MFSDGTSQVIENIDYNKMKMAVEAVGKYWLSATIKQLD